MSTSTVREALARAVRTLRAAGVEGAEADARRLLGHAMDASPAWLFAHDEKDVPARRLDTFEGLIGRRAERVPLQHLLGRQDFWRLSVSVGPEVLIPRPETEHLVEAALDALSHERPTRAADVGTGSGCIALALLVERPLLRVVGTDVSSAALDRARRNAGDVGVEERLELLEGDLVAPLSGRAFDAVVANLPYVSDAGWQALEPEVRDHDPRAALVGGPDGTELVERFVAEVPRALAPGGWVGLEVGAGQARRVARWLRARGFLEVRCRPDLAGIERVVEGRLPR